ncbi:Hypothetical protein Lpl7_0014 [Lacticaseibacillus paracasei subsp. tolerans Lpl7]|nr:Hypothetical protein Lpl7_0014 [Lacticaseibacillus paracasei subsp. tolerans Lpl7]
MLFCHNQNLFPFLLSLTQENCTNENLYKPSVTLRFYPCKRFISALAGILFRACCASFFNEWDYNRTL